MRPTIDQLQTSIQHGIISLSELLFLRRHLQTPFKLHPLGFIACTLLSEGTKKLRLHYWPVDSTTQQSPNCQIHDHLFEFRSWVLSGAVENIEYATSPSGTEFAVYKTEYSGDKSILTKTGAFQKLVAQSRKLYSAGSSYSVSVGVMHETVRSGVAPAFTALITNDISKASPLVLGPIEGEDRYSYQREVISEIRIEKMLANI